MNPTPATTQPVDVLPEGDSLVGATLEPSRTVKSSSSELDLMSKKAVRSFVTDTDKRLSAALHSADMNAIQRHVEVSAAVAKLADEFNQAADRSRDAAAAVIQLGLALEGFITAYEQRTWRGRLRRFRDWFELLLGQTPTPRKRPAVFDPRRPPIVSPSIDSPNPAFIAQELEKDRDQLDLEILPDPVREVMNGGGQ